MEAVCRTGSDVFRSGLPFKISKQREDERPGECLKSRETGYDGIFHKTVEKDF